MHVVLLTLMTLSGADVTAAQPASYGPCGSAACCESAYGSGAAGHSSHYERKINRQLGKYMSGKQNGPMPQTCYAPRFGCYNGNDRHMHRYPAFHGTYYRRPYNYRNLFEYPWHAEMHEPTSYFSYNVPTEAMPIPQQDAPPALPADAAARHQGIPMPRPVAQPVPTPAQFKSASHVEGIESVPVRTVPAPRLSDQDLSGVSTKVMVEHDRVVPAPIESLADATPYLEDRTIEVPAIKTPETKTPEFKVVEATVPEAKAPETSRSAVLPVPTPRVASRPLSAGPTMLRPIAAAQPSVAPLAPQAVAPAELELPSIKAKPISLGKPESIELKPLAPKSEVTQAKADESTESEVSPVQTTSATQAIASPNALRAATPNTGTVNPLRGSLRR